MTVTSSGFLTAWLNRPETVFNSAQSALQVAAGGLVLTLGGWASDRPDFGHAGQVLLGELGQDAHGSR